MSHISKQLTYGMQQILHTAPKPILCYVWIDGTKQNVRAKSRTWVDPRDINEIKVDELPMWNFDGSSTGQASGNLSDVALQPVALYKDPIRGGNHKLVLCETLQPADPMMKQSFTPHPSNTRTSCLDVMNDPFIKPKKPWFGMEQEYTLFDINGRPLGWPKDKLPEPQGPYYCGVGANKVSGRYIVDAHYALCLHAGIKICGENAEVMPSQWEFQIGPCEGIRMGDDLWMGRFLLHRVAEEYGVVVSLDPKPMEGDWNGAGLHTNVSTEGTRAEKGLRKIESMIPQLGRYHTVCMECYDPCGGKDNARRLSGKHETSKVDVFNWGVSDRSKSVRIPAQVQHDRRGYFEDRRPSSNADPYMVTEAIMRSIFDLWPRNTRTDLLESDKKDRSYRKTGGSSSYKEYFNSIRSARTKKSPPSDRRKSSRG